MLLRDFIGRLENESKCVPYKPKAVEEERHFSGAACEGNHESGCSHTALCSTVWNQSCTVSR